MNKLNSPTKELVYSFKGDTQIPSRIEDLDTYVVYSKKIQSQRIVKEGEIPILQENIQLVKNDTIKQRYAILFNTRILLYKSQERYLQKQLAQSVYPLLNCQVHQQKNTLILTYSVNNSSQRQYEQQRVTEISENQEDKSQNTVEEKHLLFTESAIAQKWKAQVITLLQLNERSLFRKQSIKVNESQQGFMYQIKALLCGLCLNSGKITQTRYSVYNITLEGINQETMPFFSSDTKQTHNQSNFYSPVRSSLAKQYALPNQSQIRIQGPITQLKLSEDFIIDIHKQSLFESPAGIYQKQTRCNVMNFNHIQEHEKKIFIQNDEENLKLSQEDEELPFNQKFIEYQLREITYQSGDIQELTEVDVKQNYQEYLDILIDEKLELLENVRNISQEEYAVENLDSFHENCIKWQVSFVKEDLVMKSYAPERVFEVITSFINEQLALDTQEEVIKTIVMQIYESFQQQIYTLVINLIENIKQIKVPAPQKYFNRITAQANILTNDIQDLYEMFDEMSRRYPNILIETANYGNEESQRELMESYILKLKLIDKLRTQKNLFIQNNHLSKLKPQL